MSARKSKASKGKSKRGVRAAPGHGRTAQKTPPRRRGAENAPRKEYVLNGQGFALAVARIATRTLYGALAQDKEFMARVQAFGKDTPQFVTLHDMPAPPGVQAWAIAQCQPGGSVEDAIASELRIAFSRWSWQNPAEVAVPETPVKREYPSQTSRVDQVGRTTEVVGASTSIPVQGDPEIRHRHYTDRPDNRDRASDYVSAKRYIIDSRVVVPAVSVAARKRGADVEKEYEPSDVPREKGHVQLPGGYEPPAGATNHECIPMCDPLPPVDPER